MAGLFPSTSKRKRFDPEDDCIVAEQHRKKKSTSKGRPKQVIAVAMKEIPSSIPKGPFREHLKKIGQVQEISFDRHLCIEEVDKLLSESFECLGKNVQFQYLKPHQKNSLSVLDNQKLNGKEVVELAKNKSLYLKFSLCKRKRGVTNRYIKKLYGGSSVIRTP